MSGFDLEDFDGPGRPGRGPDAGGPADGDAIAAAADAARVAGYEEGYKSGWDDAVQAAESDARTVGAELARNLRDLSFTYFEAREEVLSGLRPFLAELLETLFPAILPEAAAAALAHEMADAALDGNADKVRILVCPDDAEVVRGLLEGAPDGAPEVAEEPALAPGQARLTVDRREVAVDPARMLGRLRDALEAPDSGVPEEGAVMHG